jgi:hypothetical protein
MNSPVRVGSWRGVLVAATAGLCVVQAAEQPPACVEVYHRGVITTPFNPSFLHVSTFRDARGRPRDALLMSSFFNVVKNADGTKVERFVERDLAAWIPDLSAVDPATFDAKRELEVLTDRDGRAPRTVWPNETERVPDGVLPFQAIVIPGGFLSGERPGRLTLVDVDSPARVEYVVAEADDRPPVCSDGRLENWRWYYHGAVFLDVDGDGLKDLITARGSFRAFQFRCPNTGELVWFKNPGKALRPDTPWAVQVLTGLPDDRNGPEINLAAADLDSDGVVEVVATHFFTSDHITIFGPPAGKPWSALTGAGVAQLRRKTVMTGQGRPFAVQAVDLNLDGRVEILTSNHQGDGCFDMTRDAIPGRVLALLQPASGRIFDEDWRVQVLKDDIRPNPSFPPPARAPGRLAPSRAVAFWPQRSMEGRVRPWIVVGGDEASKIWVLRPLGDKGRDDWRYESAVIFDINDWYGPNTSQTLVKDPQGVSISTVGSLTWRYDLPGPDGRAEIYAPVFEAKHIHSFSFRPRAGKRIECPREQTIACPAPR